MGNSRNFFSGYYLQNLIDADVCRHSLTLSFCLGCLSRTLTSTVWKMCKYGVFLVCIFPYSHRIREFTTWISVFSPNTGKYGPEKNSVFGHFSRSGITGQQGKGEAISLTPNYHIHPLHRHVHISWTINLESSPLHIASSWTQTRMLFSPSADR